MTTAAVATLKMEGGEKREKKAKNALRLLVSRRCGAFTKHESEAAGREASSAGEDYSRGPREEIICLWLRLDALHTRPVLCTTTEERLKVIVQGMTRHRRANGPSRGRCASQENHSRMLAGAEDCWVFFLIFLCFVCGDLQPLLLQKAWCPNLKWTLWSLCAFCLFSLQTSFSGPFKKKKKPSGRSDVLWMKATCFFSPPPPPLPTLYTCPPCSSV